MKWALLLPLLAGCIGNPPSVYSDYSQIEYGGQSGGVGRVGMNIPLGPGFQLDPTASEDVVVARQQLATLLAIAEQLRGAAGREPTPIATAPEPTPADETAPAAPEALHIDDPVTAYHRLASALSWESICKVMLVTYFATAMRQKVAA